MHEIMSSLSLRHAKEKMQRESRCILFGIEEERVEFIVWIVKKNKYSFYPDFACQDGISSPQENPPRTIA